METPALAPEVNLTALPPGTKVGSWRVLGFRGRGSYGCVYSAFNEGHALAGPVALKLALFPADPCFEREVELLARIRHPSVPRLLDAGRWLHPSGRSHPFLVMQWVEGEPLYSWATRRNPSSRQVLAVLAQAAGAVHATHEVCGVHRDIKGDNMLVRPADGRLFLTDFGSGHFAGMKRLTPLHVLPGTPHYRSPQMWDYVRPEDPNATFSLLARPWDDVFALGVMAFRLVTDTYPPFTHPGTKQGQCWLPGGSGAPSPRQLNPRVDAQLNALILRMLSVRPEERGTGGELAEAMARGVAHAPPSADEPLFEWETRHHSEWTQEELAEAEQLGHRPRRRDRARARKAEQSDATARAGVARQEEEARARIVAVPPRPVSARRWLPVVAAVLAVGLWPEETRSVRTVQQPTGALGAARQQGDSVSLGDDALSSSAAAAKVPSGGAITEEVPEQPLPGQRKPDAKGRCPKKLVSINGGCWGQVNFDVEQCHGNVFYVYQGGCYTPAFVSTRQPTSDPGQPEP